MRSTSSTVRSVNARSTPGIGGTIGDAPGLRINLSYGNSYILPVKYSLTFTDLPFRLIESTSLETRTSSLNRACNEAGVCSSNASSSSITPPT